MKKSSMILAALMVIGVSLPAAAAPTLMPELIDAVVDSAGKAVTSQLSVQGWYRGGVGSFGSVQRSYLMFDLSSIPDDATIIFAQFGMDLDASNRGAYNGCDPSTGLHYVQDDTWTKDGITWGNAPAASPDGDYQATVTVSGVKTFKWDILNGTNFQWDWLADLTDDRISMMIDTRYEGKNNWAHFSNPYLKVDYTVPAVPAPAAITLGLIGLVSSRVALRKKNL